MASTTFQARFCQKFDTYENWTTSGGDVILLKGEIAVVQVPSDSTAVGGSTARPQYLVKIGDGVTKFASLPWLSAVAADVYDWAKAATKPEYSASEIKNLASYINGQIQDTNTTYQIIQDTSDKHKFTLQAKEKGQTSWTNVSTITIPDNNTTYTLVTGSTNGTVAFNGTDVKVKGLGSAAYTASDDYDAKGTGASAAAAVLGKSDDAATAATVYGAKKAAANAQSKADAALPKAGGTMTGALTLNGAPTADLHAATKKYVDEAKASAISTASTDATTKANDALSSAKSDATTKANNALSSAKAYVDEKTAGLTGAMHFAGAVEAYPPTGTYNSGDVILYNTKEYVYDGKDWHELGDEGSHVLKTQKINGHALSGDITLTAADVGAATATNITSAIQALDVASVGGSGKYIQSISETDGKISATAATMPTALKNPNALTVGSKTYDGSAAVTITATDLGAITDISGKQDKLAFEGTYNASTNKVATVSAITSKINALDKADAAVAGQVVSAVSETDGVISVSRRALVADDIPTIAASKVSGLATVATTGKIDNLTQTAYVIFNAGSATEVV